MDDYTGRLEFTHMLLLGRSYITICVIFTHLLKHMLVVFSLRRVCVTPRSGIRTDPVSFCIHLYSLSTNDVVLLSLRVRDELSSIVLDVESSIHVGFSN